jgi:hypothetical protein
MEVFESGGPALAALLSTLLLALGWWLKRQRDSGRGAMATADDDTDTVTAWPPRAVRVMTLAERQAYGLLRRALPGYLILAQVPLSRFISVPTRAPYEEWLTRAGRLSVDLLVCDASSRVLAAIDVCPEQDTPRNRKRHERMQRVLQAAGVPVHEWVEGTLPGLSDVRQMFIPASVDTPVDARGRRSLPLPEIQELDAGDEAFAHTRAHEPVSSGFFDDLQALRT